MLISMTESTESYNWIKKIKVGDNSLFIPLFSQYVNVNQNMT